MYFQAGIVKLAAIGTRSILLANELVSRVAVLRHQDVENHMKTKLETGPKRMNTRTKPSAHTDEEAANNYPRILDNISDGVYALNTDGYFTYVNKVIEERAGVPAEKIYHLRFLDLIDPEYHDLANNNFQRVMKGEDGIPYELAYTNIKGWRLTKR